MSRFICRADATATLAVPLKLVPRIPILVNASTLPSRVQIFSHQPKLPVLLRFLIYVDGQSSLAYVQSWLLAGEMRIDIALFFICFVDHFHIPRYFAFDTSVGLILHFALFIELDCSLLHIVDRATDELSLLVFNDPPADICMLVA